MTRARVMAAGLVCMAATVAGQEPQSTIKIGTLVGLPASGYQEVGRRDPFAPLVAPPTAAAPAASTDRRAAGLPGQAVADVALKGVITSGAVRLALLEGADGKTYLARAQDRLHDAVVRRIESDAVVFFMSASSPGGAREVRKLIRPVAGGGHP